MKQILARIRDHATRSPQRIAIIDHTAQLSYGELARLIEQVAADLTTTRIGLLADNGIGWAITDLAAAAAGSVCVPIPTFFSATQIRHLITDAGLQQIITDRPEMLAQLLAQSVHSHISVQGKTLSVFELQPECVPSLPLDTCKITYTSGTTGSPKGVCLSGTVIEQVALSLGQALHAGEQDRSLSLLPLSTLLENLGGLYAPLSFGAQAALPRLEHCGFQGSSRVDIPQLVAAIHHYEPTTTILVPQLLKALIEALTAGAPKPSSLRFVAVGGAPCGRALIERAHCLGLPVHEGYGLSEAASVVSLNRPGANLPGSVGEPLPHRQVEIAEDGEILIHGALFSGYLGEGHPPPTTWHTGDLGYLDSHGRLYVTGRKKTAFATAFGRNVAPEWVESELAASPFVMQSAVFGEGQHLNAALLVPHPAASADQLRLAIEQANSRLPDYARIGAWRVLGTAFSTDNRLLHASGALDRPAIAKRYSDVLEQLFAGDTTHAHV
ncbi:AMP-binding protein [Oleiagrimonas sp. C23AA]|uniref:AMP-binding protein n=1 Tax=Oleiagrimonas sp. C23AA TaxID=2719047 RepID=UPI001423AEA0|nr:AMP-binding protein [Oleiagrimonas sp. C23AA]NII10567.1 long-chain fatty acid--CoA ligase [Oleiagrimonas sp. C23AA]